jgi:DEAD/DEAH box helicase domain-containing protein
LQGEEKVRAAVMLAERKALAVEGSDGEPIRRKSAIVEAARVVASLTSHGVRTLCFAKTRKLQELVLGYARERSSTRLAGYRGGYTPAERRRIEADFFEGRLDGVVATCALELGVDVGDLDATVHLGWPGSRCSLRQQAGRAGRDPSRASLAVVVLFNGPLDQLMAQKAPLLTGEVEPCALLIAARKSASTPSSRRLFDGVEVYATIQHEATPSTRRFSTKAP